MSEESRDLRDGQPARQELCGDEVTQGVEAVRESQAHGEIGEPVSRPVGVPGSVRIGRVAPSGEDPPGVAAERLDLIEELGTDEHGAFPSVLGAA